MRRQHHPASVIQSNSNQGKFTSSILSVGQSGAFNFATTGARSPIEKTPEHQNQNRNQGHHESQLSTDLLAAHLKSDKIDASLIVSNLRLSQRTSSLDSTSIGKDTKNNKGNPALNIRESNPTLSAKRKVQHILSGSDHIFKANHESTSNKSKHS